MVLCQIEIAISIDLIRNLSFLKKPLLLILIAPNYFIDCGIKHSLYVGAKEN